jgi:SAM-dependent methyltransferase
MPWYEEDAFWAAMHTALFDAERLAGTSAEVDALLALANLAPGARVLDLCCGPGRHSLELAARGFAVTGVDRTRAYLQRARRKAARAGLAVRFRQQDMREPLGEAEYDAVVSMFTSFGYFEDPADDRRVLAHVLRALAPGGVFVLDVVGREILARAWRDRDWAHLPGGGYLLQERTLSPGWGWVESRWTLIHDGEVREYAIGHRLFGAVDLCALLEGAGFVEVRPFGSLTGDPYDQRATRLVVVGKKGA